MDYRRAPVPGGTYFFSVNLANLSGRLLVAGRTRGHIAWRCSRRAPTTSLL